MDDDRACIGGGMKERPILFSAPMVRAILAGAKTQTRRVLKPRHDYFVEDGEPFFEPYVYAVPESVPVPCPYGAPGDRLWVRERISLARRGSEPGKDVAIYDADGELTPLDTWPWQRETLPSIHMPYGLRRITLEVTSVRVERLHAITEDDARAEGVSAFPLDPEGDCWTDGKHRTAFEYLWGEINGWDSWASNPWVWVVSFSRIDAAQAKGAA